MSSKGDEEGDVEGDIEEGKHGRRGHRGRGKERERDVEGGDRMKGMWRKWRE